VKAEPLSETIRTGLPKISDQILNIFNVSSQLTVFVGNSQINFVNESTIAKMYLYCFPVVSMGGLDDQHAACEGADHLYQYSLRIVFLAKFFVEKYASHTVVLHLLNLLF